MLRRSCTYLGYFLTYSNILLYACQEHGIDGSVFQNRFKLHMTLGTLVLLDDSEIATAAALLEECRQDLIR